jgi:DNA-binding CsgD family transcriptional regulator
MAKTRVFTSFDFDHDEDLRNLLVGQAKNPDSPFELADWSVKEHMTGDWKAKVRERIRKVDQVIVICGEHTFTGGSLLLFKSESHKFNMSGVREQFGLTHREAEILMWVAYGKTNRQIGEVLAISPRTVNKHLDHVFIKLGVETRAAATAIAITRMQNQSTG